MRVRGAISPIMKLLVSVIVTMKILSVIRARLLPTVGIYILYLPIAILALPINGQVRGQQVLTPPIPMGTPV